MAIDRAAAPWGKAVFFGHHLVQRMPEWLGHPFASESRNLSKYQLDMNNWYSLSASEIEHLFSVRDHALGVIGLRSHGGDLHVEVAAMHVDGDDRRFSRPKHHSLVQFRNH